MVRGASGRRMGFSAYLPGGAKNLLWLVSHGQGHFSDGQQLRWTFLQNAEEVLRLTNLSCNPEHPVSRQVLGGKALRACYSRDCSF